MRQNLIGMLGVLLGVVLLTLADWASGDPVPPATSKAASAALRLEAQTSLARLNVLIGDWRGVGQPKRNSNKDAWTEKSTWVWDLQGDRPASSRA